MGKKLSSMGIRVIPADCLEPQTRGPTSWHFPNLIMNAVEQVKRHPNFFLLYVSNFSCTIDSFTHAQLASELGSKPYLMLEIDAHTADAGIQTRLEAFLDIVRNHQHGKARSRRPFVPARLGAGGLVTTSSGEQVPLTDPRVRLHVPAFSAYHSQAGALAMRWLGLNPGPDLTLERRQLEQGLRYTSGRESLLAADLHWTADVCAAEAAEVQVKPTAAPSSAPRTADEKPFSMFNNALRVLLKVV